MPVLLLPHLYAYLLFMSICIHFAIVPQITQIMGTNSNSRHYSFYWLWLRKKDPKNMWNVSCVKWTNENTTHLHYLQNIKVLVFLQSPFMIWWQIFGFVGVGSILAQTVINFNWKDFWIRRRTITTGIFSIFWK